VVTACSPALISDDSIRLAAPLLAACVCLINKPSRSRLIACIIVRRSLVSLSLLEMVRLFDAESAIFANYSKLGGSVAEWLACWTRAQKGLGSNHANSLRQTVYTHRASVHQAAKLIAAL